MTQNKHKVNLWGWIFWSGLSFVNLSLMLINKDFFAILGFFQIVFYSWFYFVYWGDTNE